MLGYNALTLIIQHLSTDRYPATGSSSLAKLLEPVKIDINAKDDNGLTPLMYALPLCNLFYDLVDCGADCTSFELLKRCFDTERYVYILFLFRSNVAIESDDGKETAFDLIFRQGYLDYITDVTFQTKFYTDAIHKSCIDRGLSLNNKPRCSTQGSYYEILKPQLKKEHQHILIDVLNYQTKRSQEISTVLGDNVIKQIADNIMKYIY